MMKHNPLNNADLFKKIGNDYLSAPEVARLSRVSKKSHQWAEEFMPYKALHYCILKLENDIIPGFLQNKKTAYRINAAINTHNVHIGTAALFIVIALRALSIGSTLLESDPKNRSIKRHILLIQLSLTILLGLLVDTYRNPSAHTPVFDSTTLMRPLSWLTKKPHALTYSALPSEMKILIAEIKKKFNLPTTGDFSVIQILQQLKSVIADYENRSDHPNKLVGWSLR